MVEQFTFDDMGFPLLMKEAVESAFTGILFVNNDTWRKGLIFSKGSLCAIQSNNPDELLGEIMVGMGMISQAENENSLARARIERSKQGAILLDQEVIRPDDIKNALKQQTETRLLDIFSWENGRVQKVKKESIGKTPEINDKELARLVRRGIMDKTSFSTVINALSPYADAKPKMLVDDAPSDLGVSLEDPGSYTVAEILLFGQDLPRALLAMYCTSIVSFEESKHKALIDKLRMMLKAIRDQDPFEILGVDNTISDAGLKRAYIKIVKENHPDVYSYANDPEVKRLANDIFTDIQKAHNSVLRIREGKGPEQKGLDESIQAELLFSQGTEALKMKNYQKALDLFRLCMNMRPDERVFTESYVKTLYLKLQNTGSGNSLEIKSAIRSGVKNFPSSDTLYVILGWVLKKEGSPRAADAFRKALEINKDNIDAQRELRLFHMRGKI